MLVTRDELERVALGETTHGWRRMKGLQQITDMIIGRQGEVEITTQVYEVSRTYRLGTFLMEIVGKLLQTLCDIGCHISLFLDILG